MQGANPPPPLQPFSTGCDIIHLVYGSIVAARWGICSSCRHISWHQAFWCKVKISSIFWQVHVFRETSLVVVVVVGTYFNALLIAPASVRIRLCCLRITPLYPGHPTQLLLQKKQSGKNSLETIHAMTCWCCLSASSVPDEIHVEGFCAKNSPKPDRHAIRSLACRPSASFACIALRWMAAACYKCLP